MNFRAGLPKSLIHLLAITALLVVLPACSGDGDDDLGDPGDGENDTAAPLVVQISPVDGGLIVDLNTSFYRISNKIDFGWKPYLNSTINSGGIRTSQCICYNLHAKIVSDVSPVP